MEKSVVRAVVVVVTKSVTRMVVIGRFLGPAHPTGCVPGARGAFIPVGLGVPSHPCRLAGSAGVRPGALDVRQSQPSQRLNSRRRRVLTYDAHVWRPQRRRFAAARGRRRGRRSGGWPRKGAAEAERAVTEIAADAKHRWLSQETAADEQGTVVLWVCPRGSEPAQRCRRSGGSALSR